MQQIQLQVTLDPNLPTIVPDAVAYETGATPSQVLDPALCVYEHHGEGFGPSSTGALTTFYEDLVLGRPLPLTFATRAVSDVDTVMAVTLFLHRDIAIHPATPGMVYNVDLLHRRGDVLLAHLEPDLASFLRGMRKHLYVEGITREEQGKRLTQAVEWLHVSIVDGVLPAFGGSAPTVRVIDVGTNGFVQAECQGDLQAGWLELYSQGHLRGVLFSPQTSQGLRHVVAARKSPYVSLDLTKAADILNELERALGADPAWHLEGLYLGSPPEGTSLLVRDVMKVLLHV